MRSLQRVVTILCGGVCLSLLCGCTEHPFGESKISYRNRQISGRVTLSDNSIPEGIYVWLEGFNIGTFTDQTGQFQVTLLLPENQGTSTGVNGVFNLYFYVANYQLSFAEAVVQNGDFLYSRGDFDESGEMIGVTSLLKLLRIHTTVKPDSVPMTFEGTVNVVVTMQALFDSVTVFIPKIIGGSFGAILLRRLGSDDIFVDAPNTNDYIQVTERIGPEEYIWNLGFNLVRGALPEGQYEIIPYFFIEQENMPEGLLESLGPNVMELGPDYLRIPFKREGGHFEVTGIE